MANEKEMVVVGAGYTQPGDLMKLFGSPAGYVGYGQPSLLDQARSSGLTLAFVETSKMAPGLLDAISEVKDGERVLRETIERTRGDKVSTAGVNATFKPN